jgi:hypothetical protein
MNYKAIKWATSQPLDSKPKLLLLVLAVSASRDGYTIMAQEKLGDICGTSQGWVTKHMKTLIELDLIHVTKRATNGPHMMNEYHLMIGGTKNLSRLKELSLLTRGGGEVKELCGHLVVRSPQYLMDEAVLPLNYVCPDTVTADVA